MIESLVTWCSQLKHHINPINELHDGIFQIWVSLWKGSKFWKKDSSCMFNLAAQFVQPYLMITVRITELWQTLILPSTLTSIHVWVEVNVCDKCEEILSNCSWNHTFTGMGQTDRWTTWKHDAFGHNCHRCRGVKSCDQPDYQGQHVLQRATLWSFSADCT